MNEMNYPFIAGTPSKPENSWLGFNSLQLAKNHAGNMNKFLDDYGDEAAWNYSIWPTKPEAWISKENPDYLAVAVEAGV